MNWDAIGAIGEIVGAFAVVVTLVYLAAQIRQSNSQQKREEIVAVQTGVNRMVAQMEDPAIARAYAMTADGENPTRVADRSRAIFWVVQYLNHFEIIYDLYHNGSLDDERYQHWESIAVSILASTGIRAWWEDGSGRWGFPPKVRDLLDQKLNDEENPPVSWDAMWEFMNAETWRNDEAENVTPEARL